MRDLLWFVGALAACWVTVRLLDDFEVNRAMQGIDDKIEELLSTE